MALLRNIAIEIVKHFQQYTWWEITIFIIGILSFIAVIVILLFPIASGPEKFTTTSDVPPAASPEFIQTLSYSLTLPMVEGGEPIKILNNGDEFLQSLLSDIDNAKSSINIMVYIWDEGKMNDQIFEHLNAKLKEGVEVRIIFDAFGAIGASKRDEFKTFEDLGGKAKFFRSLSIAPWNILRNHKRNHQRSIAIDGKIGYAGGMAVGDKWLGDARNKEEWRDTMFRTTGSMARDIQGAFSHTWASTTGEFLIGDKFFPPIAKSKNATITYMPFVSNPAPDSPEMEKLILLSVLSAQNKIYINSPYFIPNQALSDILISKVKEGVDVKVLVPNEFNDSKSVRAASQYYYQELLEGGVKIYEYQPTFIHAKSMVIDGIWSIIGSANMDNRSRVLNEENVFGIWDTNFGAEIEKLFQEDLKEVEEVKLADWNKRGRWQRFKEYYSQKFVHQF